MPIRELARASDDLHYSEFTAPTPDREDHSFSGMFFSLGCATALPIDSIEISAISVRGNLGRVRVYAKNVHLKTFDDALPPVDVSERYGHYSANDANVADLMDAEAWGEPAYDEEHRPSYDELVALKLNAPITLRVGEKVQVYVHTDARSDKGLVYDDERDVLGRPKCDGVLQIYPGYAHLSHEPFGKAAPWYAEDETMVSSLRKDRRFVGMVSYGVRWMLWQPEREIHARFPSEFQEVVRTMLRGMRDPGSILSVLDENVMMYTLNKYVGWEWFGRTLKAREYPPFAESSGSPRVDVVLEALFLEHVKEGNEQTPYDDTHSMEFVATAMVRTIVSRSPELRVMLHGCTLRHRVEALLHMLRSCYEKVVQAKSDRKTQGSQIVGIKQKYLLPEYNAQAIANDLDTVRNVTNIICTHVSHLEGWRPADVRSNTHRMSPDEHESDETDLSTVQEVLEDHIRSLHVPLKSFMNMNSPRPYDDVFDDLDDDDDDFDDDDDEDDWEADEGDWIDYTSTE